MSFKKQLNLSGFVSGNRLNFKQSAIVLVSGRSLQRKKNILKQSPGIQPNVLDEIERQSLSRKLSPDGYHMYEFIVFDKMTIHVCFIKKAKKHS